jgi:benzoyl-CoA reductase/2-hydroxyglutaryl-CoA dehydratase subunit BcrC/BadD/HgdB
MKTLEKLIHDFSIDGVVDLTWQGCHGFNVESRVINEKLDVLEIPFLQIETGYSESDTEQIRTRIEAFLESLS